MSRSIHTTRREVDTLADSDFSAVDRREAALARARDRLAQKGRIKAAVLRERRRRPEKSPTSADLIPIVIDQPRPHVHHLVTEQDVRSVLRRLPPGVVDGLRRIDLRLGAEAQRRRQWGDPSTLTPDPLVGRLGHERLPGVYSGRVLGTYTTGSGIASVYAYVYDDGAPLRKIWEPLLRLYTLTTLVHEIAHHHDQLERIARGRWMAHGHERVEIYAQQRTDAWMHFAVIPHLRECYATDVDRLEEWVATHGGVRLSFESMAGSTRTYGTQGTEAIRAFFTMETALEHLFEAVIAGRPLGACRVGFATDLHYREMYDEALRSLSVVLAADPADLAALVLRADIMVHLERHLEALEIVVPIADADPDNESAWEVRADALEELGRWADLIPVADRLVALAPPDEPHAFGRALFMRALAALRSGDLDRAQADLDRIAALGVEMRHWRRRHEKLTAELLAARTGK